MDQGVTLGAIHFGAHISPLSLPHSGWLSLLMAGSYIGFVLLKMTGEPVNKQQEVSANGQHFTEC